MAKNPFGKLHLDTTKLEACLAKNGAENIAITRKTEKEEQIYFLYNKKSFLIRLYTKKDGTHSLGKATGYCKETYEHFASIIARDCKISDVSRFEFSTKNISEEDFEALIDYLIEENAELIKEKKEMHTAHRLTDPKGDRITIKRYSNGTTQFQGKLLRLATLTQDFLSNVLSLDEALNSQISTYKIPTTVDNINAELTTRIPRAIENIEESLQTQFSASLAMTKVELPIEDHSAIAFPALRGLEGHIKTMLVMLGFQPTQKMPVGEYFPEHGRMDKGQRCSVGERMAKILEKCYAHYHQHRHRLFHMDVTVSTSKTLDRQEAIRVVDETLSLIEQSYIELKSYQDEKTLSA